MFDVWFYNRLFVFESVTKYFKFSFELSLKAFYVIHEVFSYLAIYKNVYLRRNM